MTCLVGLCLEKIKARREGPRATLLKVLNLDSHLAAPLEDGCKRGECKQARHNRNRRVCQPEAPQEIVIAYVRESGALCKQRAMLVNFSSGWVCGLLKHRLLHIQCHYLPTLSAPII